MKVVKRSQVGKRSHKKIYINDLEMQLRCKQGKITKIRFQEWEDLSDETKHLALMFLHLERYFSEDRKLYSLCIVKSLITMMEYYFPLPDNKKLMHSRIQKWFMNPRNKTYYDNGKPLPKFNEVEKSIADYFKLSEMKKRVSRSKCFVLMRELKDYDHFELCIFWKDHCLKYEYVWGKSFPIYDL